MRLNLEMGRALLVDGPASVALTSGSATVLGTSIKEGSRIVVRNGKRLPIEITRNATFELTMGEASAFLELEGLATPDSWRRAVDDILELTGPISVLILGGVDSGKTSFCTYLANRAIERSWKVALIDGDLGQSDISSPATIGLACLKASVVDLFEVEADNVVFVGPTSPAKALDACLNAFATLKERCAEMDSDLLIVNTDGWIEGEDAVNYKAQIVDLFSPNVIVAVKGGDELNPIVGRLRDSRTAVVDTPKAVKRRSREARKALRELGYKKYLKGAKVKSYNLSYIEVKGYHELGDSLIGLEKEEGLLVGLEDQEERFLGIGVLSGIDRERRMLKVYTPVAEPSPRVLLGQVKLSFGGNEIC